MGRLFSPADGDEAAIAAILLAAGESTRMGAPKALLADGGGHLFVTRLLHTFRAAGVTRLTIVTGSLHGRLVEAVSRDFPSGASVTFVQNPDPSRGQLSSLLAGLDGTDRPGLEAILLTPVDVPFVKPSTVRAVAAAWRRTGAPIVRPARGDRHGHPVLFARSAFAELRRADPALGARAVLRAHAPAVVDVEVDDDGALLDVDTRADYDRLLRGGPSSAETLRE